MNFKEVFAVSSMIFVAAASIAMTGILAGDQPLNESTEFATSNETMVRHLDHRIPVSQATDFASRIETSIEEDSLTVGHIRLIQVLECASCGQVAARDGSCGCGAGGQSIASATCNCDGGSDNGNCGRSGCRGSKGRGERRIRGQILQGQLKPVCMPCSEQSPGPVKGILGVNEFVGNRLGREPTFQDSQIVPWEMFAYGEYIGPHRTPHVPEYRMRVNDSLQFVYFMSRKQSINPYQIYVGDTIRISSLTDPTINQPVVVVLSDGTISLPLIGQVRAAGKTVADLQDELDNLYLVSHTAPSMLVQIVEGDTPLKDVIASVDATQGAGGQNREATVSPDGTIQLPVIGSVPAVGLTLDEIRREVNARYRDKVEGLEVTPVLLDRAPRFAYVLGQVAAPGRFELVGPTTVLQAIALAEGDLQGGNLRNIVIFRRDEQWRLTATRLDLAGAVHGRRPFPSDEMFLRDSDIVLIPRKPIQRLSEAVDLYLTRTLYGIFPQQVVWDFDDVTGF